MPIKPGEKAPDFALKGHDDKEYKLSDFKELLKSVKQNFPELPVVLITGYEAEFNPEEEPKPDGFLLKPFKVQQIDEVLKRIPNF